MSSTTILLETVVLTGWEVELTTWDDTVVGMEEVQGVTPDALVKDG